MSLLTPNLSTDVAARMQFPIDVSDQDWGGERIVYTDGASQGYLTRDRFLREWEISYEKQKKAERDAIIAFLTARKGSFQKFYFDHPTTGEVDIPVFYVKRSLRESGAGPTLFNLSFRIAETT